MRRRAIRVAPSVVAGIVFQTLASVGPASAEPPDDCTVTLISVVRAGHVETVRRVSCPPTLETGAKPRTGEPVVEAPSRPFEDAAKAGCYLGVGPEDSPDWRSSLLCGDATKTAPTTVRIESLVTQALQRTRIPKAKVVIQPPGGKTLINFDTLYRTRASTFTRSFRLLGSRVSLRIRPTSYTWVTGDGEQFTTTDPGIAYDPDLPMTAYISHNYEHAADALHPRVDVTWAASYRVGKGRWLPVQGTVTTTGTEADLKVVEARTVLFSGYGR